MSQAYEIFLSTPSSTGLAAGPAAGSALWTSGKIVSNRTTYIPLAAANLTSDREYHWAVRCWVGGEPTAWANASFSTALMHQEDWKASEWITSPGGDAPGQYASQMRKVFHMPTGGATRGRLFLALPGYGALLPLPAVPPPLATRSSPPRRRRRYPPLPALPCALSAQARCT